MIKKGRSLYILMNEIYISMCFASSICRGEDVFFTWVSSFSHGSTVDSQHTSPIQSQLIHIPAINRSIKPTPINRSVIIGFIWFSLYVVRRMILFIPYYIGQGICSILYWTGYLFHTILDRVFVPYYYWTGYLFHTILDRVFIPYYIGQGICSILLLDRVFVSPVIPGTPPLYPRIIPILIPPIPLTIPCFAPL